MENVKDALQFFMPMIPPTITAQEHNVAFRGGKPVFYDPPKLEQAREKLTAHLAKFKPDKPFEKCALRLTAKWLFPFINNKHKDGEYRITRPDTDNLNKMLKDCMTACGYWKDDCLVASEIIEKFWADTPGIFIRIEVLDNDA